MQRSERENRDRASGITRQIHERYPWFADVFFGSADSLTAKPVPPLVGAMLHTMDHGAEAACIVLPAKDELAFALALTNAFGSIKGRFEHVELDRLTTPLRPGTKVRVAPDNRVWLVHSDGARIKGKRWIGLRNPADDQISYISEDEAFRLTPTDCDGPKPKKGSRIDPWSASPLDALLEVNTGGNLDVFGCRVILVAPQQKTSVTAEDVLVSGANCVPTPASALVTWGRVKKNGRIVAKDQSVEPIIAVTHSVTYMAEACRFCSDDNMRIVVDGAAGLAKDPQAFSYTAERHKLMILSDHSELDKVQLLEKQGCDVWAPEPEIVLALLRSTDGAVTPFTRPHAAARNCSVLKVTPVVVRDSRIEELHELIKKASSYQSDEETGRTFRTLSWRLLLLAAEWVGTPSGGTLDAFRRVCQALASAIQNEGAWISPKMRHALERSLEIAANLPGTPELGADKGNALTEYLNERNHAAIVVRNALVMNQVRLFLESPGIDQPLYLPHNMSPETCDSVLVCSWLGKDRMSKLVTRYPSRQLDVLSYPFEEDWLWSYVDRWINEWTRFRRSTDETRRITGLKAWPTVRREARRRLSAPRAPSGRIPYTDPISTILDAARKDKSLDIASPTQGKHARFISYEGDGYSYLTDGHKVPHLTELILGHRPDVRRIPLVSATELEVGDFVLFRTHGDRDIVASEAERALGSEIYNALREKADRWRPALASLGDNFDKIYRTLRRAGLTRQRSTVRTWLNDDDRIGPGEKADFETIIRASHDRELLNALDDLWQAVVQVRIEHRQAGATLSELLLLELPAHLDSIMSTPCQVNLSLGAVWIVEVDDIAEDLTIRPQSQVNRFLLDDIP
ncbi:MAG: hypothetical protein F4Z82_14920 [Caldilineaceae bacterium SB0668_bin_21]|nr:hypothetical protein [Caldilineaceae bacterium SB0668_bin_21]MYC21826.1 hypothetical protein [Caldilineaceae bacterium SB0662_bin_25]